MSTVYVTHPRCVEHDLPGHPEHAGRIRAVWDELNGSGLAARMQQVTAQPVTNEQILYVHTAEHVANLERVHREGLHAQFDSDTYLLPVSPEVARLSAGGVVAAVNTVLRGETANGLAVTRPPGHHAVPERGMGFCLLGNIAIAARHARYVHGIERVMIIDYDVHHGNGTQDMFYDDPGVLFVSSHQHPFYPGSGGVRETGRGDGRGYTMNLPLSARSGDDVYMRIYEEIVWAMARRYQPQIILVSAGFDAHWSDPLASMQLTLTGYARLTQMLNTLADELCGGKIVYVMEGGYDLIALAHGIGNIARSLLGDTDISDPYGPPPRKRNEPDIEDLIGAIKVLHRL